jgi:DNA-binding CsgD family transcriptional regulator
MERRSGSDVMDAIAGIAGCATEADANSHTKMVVRMLGAQWFVYTTLLPSREGIESGSCRYFIGCSPDLCALYSRRMWILNDPLFEYARSNTAPIVGSMLKLQTQGQAEMVRAAAQHGFSSCLVVPTHTSMGANRRMGLLYVGSELPPALGEPLLMRKRVQFGALGSELLLWWNCHLKAQAMRRLSLEEDDVELLRLSMNGKSANEIAAICDMKLTTAYRRLSSIKDKFNVDRIEQAVAQAQSFGLLA